MKIEEILHHLKPGTELMIANRPFTYGGKATVELDGGDLRYWLFDADGNMLSVSPDDEELMLFEPVGEELEPEDDLVTYDGRDHEFSYDDAGRVATVEGEADVEEDARYKIADYEDDDGALVRLLTNEDTEDVYAYTGSVVVEDDIVAVE